MEFIRKHKRRIKEDCEQEDINKQKKACLLPTPRPLSHTFGGNFQNAAGAERVTELPNTWAH